ncbi:hypothetical protein OG317_36560 [Streptomyces sp. NBC_01167]|uniref:hypothetical protein n=1 Tax=Streptomyces sp. NBC_01167 TaxID=2903756 RepID=UPI0038670E96|nr:hypothetical protein OG317_36560 [Streptomyces sp. NBC_01167]
MPGEQLTNRQLSVVLRHRRYTADPPMSYQQAVRSFRQAGFIGSEERVRQGGALLVNEDRTETSKASETGAEEEAGA